MRRPPKFYASVAVGEGAGDAFSILLDDRPAKTPGGKDLIAPTHALAAQIAREWDLAGERIDFQGMPLTRLASTVIDLAETDRGQWAAEIMNFAKSDLLCYRAEAPAALAQRQEQVWRPYLDWARTDLGARFDVTTGVVAIEQAGGVINAVKRRVEAFDDWTLLGARRATELAGSAILGLALHAGSFEAADIFEASRVDERFQAEKWGVDNEAAGREGAMRADFMAVECWFVSLRM